MKKAELMKLVGQDVTVTLFDDTVLTGRLGYVTEFSARFDWKKPNYFYINNYNFKVSHTKKVVPTISNLVQPFLCRK